MKKVKILGLFSGTCEKTGKEPCKKKKKKNSDWKMQSCLCSASAYMITQGWFVKWP